MQNLYNDLERLRIKGGTDKNTKRSKKWIIIFITALSFLSTTLFLFARSISSVKKVSIIVVSKQVSEDPSILLTAGGYIVAESEITVSSKVAGKIAILNVREGDLVHKGDIIAILDNEELRVQMEEAEANFKKAILHLKHKRELLEKEQSDLTREKELFKEKLISPSQLDKNEKNFIIARLELDQAESELEVCRKQHQLAKIRFEESTIKAPINGTVINKVADVGEMLFPMKTTEGKPGSAIVTLADLKVMNVEIDVNENDIKTISAGQPAVITPDAFPERTYQGEVINISPMADRQKNIVPVNVRIKNSDEYLKPEMSAKVTFQEKLMVSPKNPKKPTIKIPRKAVVNRNNKNIVFVIEDFKVRGREIQWGAEQADYLMVENGLEGGEKIVVEGQKDLHENDKVTFQ